MHTPIHMDTHASIKEHIHICACMHMQTYTYARAHMQIIYTDIHLLKTCDLLFEFVHQSLQMNAEFQKLATVN